MRMKRVRLKDNERPILTETGPASKERIEAIKGVLVEQVIQARHDNNVVQKRLEAVTGVKQIVITRLECGITDPHLTTLIKLLLPLGKTLAVVPLEPRRNKVIGIDDYRGHNCRKYTQI